MKIALTHNLRRNDAEAEAEFYQEENVVELVNALEANGHRVARIDVDEPIPKWLERLVAFGPDLIFNSADGREGRAREAFFPALYEAMGLPYTGSDAHTMMVTLDKRLAKEVLAPLGVPMARHRLVTPDNRPDCSDLQFPVLCKPNFEGSSKGITDDGVVEDPSRLNDVVTRLLETYSHGVLVEEFIAGVDVAVAYLENAPSGGVLEPFRYFAAPEKRSRYNIYDYRLKNVDGAYVTVHCPTGLDPEVNTRVRNAAQTIFRALNVRDLGRIDFRLGDDGIPRFLEVNPLPWLTPDAGIFDAARLQGLSFVDVIGSIVASAARRYGLRM